MVHRLLNNYLNYKNDVSLEKAENLCKHASEQEIKAKAEESLLNTCKQNL